MNLLLAYDLATVFDDDALHVSIDAATAEVEDTLGAVGVDGADDGPDGVRATAFTGGVAAAEYHGVLAPFCPNEVLSVHSEMSDVVFCADADRVTVSRSRIRMLIFFSLICLSVYGAE